ncbi:MAG: hypothetical protein GEU80_01915 [Dehalococcoidia bacterium]|nr:hypothetical protein [Dehalococcoidia bacterium]
MTGRPPTRPPKVTRRQREVARLVAEGRTNPEIADALGISLDGAKYHVSELLTRLNLERREEIAEWYATEGRRSVLDRLRSLVGLRLLFGAGASVVAAAGVLVLFAALSENGRAVGTEGASDLGEPAAIDLDGAPAELIAFAAGGSIYTVLPDGSRLTKVVDGSRASAEEWASAPALSPDRRSIVFVRDYDIWVVPADGGRPVRLLDVGPSPGLSSWALGAQSVSWSPDGQHVAYVVSRLSGSGVSQLWVARADGTAARLIADGARAWIFPTWTVDGHIAIIKAGGAATVLDTTGTTVDDVALPVLGLNEAVWFDRALADAGLRVLAGNSIVAGPIRAGVPGQLSTVASGLAPAPSPDRQEFIYLADSEIRRVSASDVNSLLVDLAPLGHPEEHFASVCSSERCSYRPPALSWQ